MSKRPIALLVERRSFLKVLLAVVAAPLVGFAAVRPKPFTGWKGHYDPPISVVTPEWDALGYPHLDDSNEWFLITNNAKRTIKWSSTTGKDITEWRGGWNE